MSHLYTIFLLFSSLRFIMIDSQTTEIERRGEPQTFYFRSFWPRPPSFARDSMDSLRLEFFPWNNEEEIYVLPIKAHWTGLECFYALAVLTFRAADWTRSESRCLMSRANPTWLTSLLSGRRCLFVLVRVPDTTEEHFNLSTAKCTTQRRLRSHTCASRDLKALMQVSSCFYCLHLIPVCLCCFKMSDCIGLCIHFGGTSSRATEDANVGLAFWSL